MLRLVRNEHLVYNWGPGQPPSGRTNSDRQRDQATAHSRHHLRGTKDNLAAKIAATRACCEELQPKNAFLRYFWHVGPRTP